MFNPRKWFLSVTPLTLGMIAKEEALGFWLCGVFRGAFP